MINERKVILEPPGVHMQKQLSCPLLPTPTSINPVSHSVVSTNATLSNRLAVSMAANLASFSILATPCTPRKHKKEDGWKEVGKR